MAKRKKTGQHRIIPEPLRQGLRQGGVLVRGAVLAVLGLATVLALASFDAADPSFNRATPAPPANWLHLPGAYGADLLLQTLGLAAILIGLALLAWGGQILFRPEHRLSRPWLRLCLLPLAVLLGAVALAGVPAPHAWPFSAGLGGVTGALGISRAAEIVNIWWGLDQARPLVAIAAALPGLAAGIWALGFEASEWSWAGRNLRAGAAWIGGHATSALGLAARGIAALLLWLWGTARRALARLKGGHVAIPDVAAFVKDHLPRVTVSPPPALQGEAGAPAAPADPPAAPTPEGFRATAEGSREPVVTPRPRPAPGKRAEAARQARLNLGGESYEMPGLELLTEAPPGRRTAAQNNESLKQNARMLESVLEDFGIKGEITEVRPGPVVTLYELVPAPGVKTSRVVALADDIARSMSAVSARVAVVPGRNAIGIELPNSERETVCLREILGSSTYERSTARLPLVLGKDIGGAPEIVDLARMPHLLIAGTTGSGKSVAINDMILSLLYRLTPDECKLIMIDPKMLELSIYEGIPHLIAPVVTEPKKAVVALKWAVREMETRYRNMSKLGVRNITGYNERVGEAKGKGEVLSRRIHTGYDEETGKPVYEDETLDLTPMPYIVIIVDEMADLMLVAGKDIEATIQRLAQMARAAGIHLIMATQRPSVDVITGTIKANFPNRISFQVTSKIDSRTILGEPGAEQLLGQGDMLHMGSGGRIARVHGPFVSDEEVEAVVAALRAQGEPAYQEAVTEEIEDGTGGDSGAGNRDGYDELFDEAVALVVREGKASTSFVQRHLQIGYNRAARIIEKMERDGVVSPADRVGRREVLAPGRDEATG